jgi:hypothetical protein
MEKLFVPQGGGHIGAFDVTDEGRLLDMRTDGDDDRHRRLIPEAMPASH